MRLRLYRSLWGIRIGSLSSSSPPSPSSSPSPSPRPRPSSSPNVPSPSIVQPRELEQDERKGEGGRQRRRRQPMIVRSWIRWHRGVLDGPREYKRRADGIRERRARRRHEPDHRRLLLVAGLRLRTRTRGGVRRSTFVGRMSVAQVEGGGRRGMRFGRVQDQLSFGERFVDGGGGVDILRCVRGDEMLGSSRHGGGQIVVVDIARNIEPRDPSR